MSPEETALARSPLFVYQNDRLTLNGSLLEQGLAGTAVSKHHWRDLADQAFARINHGDLPRWLAALGDLPDTGSAVELDRDAPRLGLPAHDRAALKETLMALHPWRKGPLELGGVLIDTEWRSDWKWQRLREHLDLGGATVLDVGCGNGYFGWRMLGAGARCVVGIDPTVLFVMQWLAQAHFAGPALAGRNLVLPLRDTDLGCDAGGFDCVLSLGVLYHRRDPQDHIQRLIRLCRPGGQLVIESLVVTEGPALHPKDRYARMRNVHEVSSIDGLLARIERAGGRAPRLVDLTPTTVAEQRSTQWMTFESLDRCLDPEDPTRTVEGYPAPVRAIVTAQAPG